MTCSQWSVVPGHTHTHTHTHTIIISPDLLTFVERDKKKIRLIDKISLAVLKRNGYGHRHRTHYIDVHIDIDIDVDVDK